MKAAKREKGGEEKKSSKDEEDTNGLFASCSFSDLGLHATLCEHLQGFALNSIWFSNLFHYLYIDGAWEVDYVV